MSTLRRVLATCFAVVALASAPALAQDAETVEGARALFERGVAEHAEGRHDAAVASFRASLALHPMPATAFNLAIALGDRGSRAEAMEVLLDLLDGRHGELEPERVDLVRAQIESVRGELVALSVRVRGVDAARALVGEREIPLDDEGEGRLVLAAGTVTLRAVHDASGASESRELTLAPGEDRSVTIVLAPPLPDPGPGDVRALDPEPMEAAPPIEESPALWLGIAGGVLAVAAVIVTVVVTQGQARDTPALGTHATLTFDF